MPTALEAAQQPGCRAAPSAGQMHDETGALPQRAPYLDAALMRTYKGRHDRQTQAQMLPERIIGGQGAGGG